MPEDNAYGPTVYLNLWDMAVDNPNSPGVIRVCMKQSMTDPFRRAEIYSWGKHQWISALYQISHGKGEAKLAHSLVFTSRLSLTRKSFIGRMREALQATGQDEVKYCGHSFHIKVATMTAAKGLEDSVIKTLGRQRSLTYLQY